MKTTIDWLKTHVETDAATSAIVDRLVMLGHDVEGIENRGRLRSLHRSLGRVGRTPPQCRPAEGVPRRHRQGAGSGHLRRAECPCRHEGGVCAGRHRDPANRRPIAGNHDPRRSLARHAGSADETGPARITRALSNCRRMRRSAEYASYAGLGDVALDIKATRTAPIASGVRGIARDLAAVGIGQLKPLDATRFREFSVRRSASISRTIRLPAVSRTASARLAQRIEPRLAARSLEAIGLRPISALVDITNFLTFDVDRPLHVFDAGRLAGPDRALRAAGEDLARPQRPGIRARRRDDRDRRRGRSAEPRRRDRRRGYRLHRGDNRGVDRGGIVRPGSHRRDRPQARCLERCALPFRAGSRPGLCPRRIEIATRLMLDLCGGEASEIVRPGRSRIGSAAMCCVPSGRRPSAGSTCSPEESAAILTALGFVVERLTGDNLGRAALVARRHRGRGRCRRGSPQGQGLRPDPGGTARSRHGIVAPVLDPGPAAGRTRPPHPRARGLVEAVTFSFISAREAELFGGAKPELRLGEPDQRRSRRDAAFAAARARGGRSTECRPRLSRCGVVRAWSALSR